MSGARISIPTIVHIASKGGRYWTPAEDAQLRALRKDGKTDAQIAVILGKTYDSVNHRARRILGSENLRIRSAWTEEEDIRLLGMRKMKKTAAQCAEALSKTTGSVEQRLRRLRGTGGRALKPREKYVPPKWEERVEREGREDYWRGTKSGDAKFRAAMRAAGYREAPNGPR